MNDRGFDNWTRTLAGLGSRRRVLGGLLGASGTAFLGMVRRGAPEAAAHHATVGPGEPCRDDSQCVAADAPMVCAWNGYGSAGQYCCTYEGNRCGFDGACCGSALCIGGYCSSGSPGSCTGVGCACTTGTYSPCDDGLLCCAIYPGLAGGAGVCQYGC